MARRGRPPKLNEAVLVSIETACEAGNHADTAARAAGIDPATFFRWMAEGKRQNGRKRYRDFRDRITRARAKAENRMVMLIALHAEKDAKAAMFYLERTNPRRWGRRDHLEAKIEEREPLTHEERLRRVTALFERTRRKLPAVGA